MKSYRERYFEDYIAVENPKKPGKVIYQYAGNYVEAYVEKKDLSNHKGSMALTELLSIFLFVYGATQAVEFNSIRIVSGLGILSLIPWAVEIWCLFRFLICGQYMKELDYERISEGLKAGSLIHAGLLIVMAIFGSPSLIQTGSIEESLQVIACYICMAVASISIYRLYKKVYYHTYSNSEVNRKAE